MVHQQDKAPPSRWLMKTVVGAALTAFVGSMVTFWLEERRSSAEEPAQPVAEAQVSDSAGAGSQGSSREVAPPAEPSPSPAGTTAEQPGPRTLEQGKPLRIVDPEVTLSVSFSDELGGMATLRIHPAGSPTITEALLGPGGRIPFRTPSGEHAVSVIDWDPPANSLSVQIE